MSPIRTLLAVFALAVPRFADAAITIDGQLDPDYGPPTIVQTLQTGLNSGGQIPGDNTLADLNFASGSELDGVYALMYDGKLRLFITGNLALRLTMQGNETRGHALDLFIDSAPDGQNQLMSISTGHPLNGMTFDAGFLADYWFEFYGEGSPADWWAARGVLETPNGGTYTVLGHGPAGGPGTLTGGTNPFGVKVTIDNRNVGGVTFGCNASSGDGVTRGIEWEIPLTAIGSPTGCIRMIAFVRDNSATSNVSNSVLAPAPVGTCDLGPAQFVNFANVAGDQTFEVCPSVIGVPGTGTGPTLSLAGANPARASGLVFRASEGTLELFDVAGRLVRRRVLDASGPVDLSEGRRLAPGLYWARLTHADGRITRKICIAE